METVRCFIRLVFTVLAHESNRPVTKKEMREAVQRIYRERKALTASLKDMSRYLVDLVLFLCCHALTVLYSAVAKLDGVLLFVALIGIIFLCLLIFNRSNTVESLVPLATIVLGFSFVFGHSAQTLFESVSAAHSFHDLSGS